MNMDIHSDLWPDEEGTGAGAGRGRWGEEGGGRGRWGEEGGTPMSTYAMHSLRQRF